MTQLAAKIDFEQENNPAFGSMKKPDTTAGLSRSKWYSHMTHISMPELIDPHQTDDNTKVDATRSLKL